MQVFLVSKDLFGNVDPSPLMVPLTTAADTSAPAVLAPSGPNSITASSFRVNLTMDATGGVYYMVLTAKPSAAVGEPDVNPGNWTVLERLPSAGRRRLLSLLGSTGSTGPWQQLSSRGCSGEGSSGDVGGLAGLVASKDGPSRGLLEGSSSTPSPGSLVLPTCYPSNITCGSTPTSAFARVAGLSAFDVLGSGCTPAPAAGQVFSLPAVTSLQNNTLYYVLVATEDRLVPSPNIEKEPTIFAIRTVDLSAAKLACGFPTVTNITSSGFTISVMLTKQAWAFYVVLPTSQVGCHEDLLPTSAGCCCCFMDPLLLHPFVFPGRAQSRMFMLAWWCLPLPSQPFSASIPIMWLYFVPCSHVTITACLLSIGAGGGRRNCSGHPARPGRRWPGRGCCRQHDKVWLAALGGVRGCRGREEAMGERLWAATGRQLHCALGLALLLVAHVLKHFCCLLHWSPM
jgi:hypothetical protein